MKFVSLAILLFFNTSFAQKIDSTTLSQKEIQKIIAEISSIIKKNALVSDSLNWDAINQQWLQEKK